MYVHTVWLLCILDRGWDAARGTWSCVQVSPPKSSSAGVSRALDSGLPCSYCPYSGSKDYVARRSTQLLKDQLFQSSLPLLAWGVGSVLPAYKLVVISKTGLEANCWVTRRSTNGGPVH